ncbi:MAG: right-handed parallel beta-helix repeat-containing protein [Candidatus Moranbacteria bacterium]|nr:right-handed parallel beta-helix repeat-containing protein [Candidatus Moranbacteria bacterium]
MAGNSRLENISSILEKKSGDEWYLNSYLKNEVNIWVGNGSNVTIKNIIVSGGKIGIETDGKGQFNLEDSKVTKTAKAVYIKKGRDFNIANSNISDNFEEGIDIRDDVRGVISNNKIENNDLSGIEVVMGFTKIDISNNIISNNVANGILFQYYKDADATGEFKINNNTILNNQRNGINCTRPRGGSPGGKYWSDSIEEMNANLIRGNELGNFHSSCKFSDEMKFNALRTETLEDKIEKGYYEFLVDEVDRQIIQTAVQNRSKLKTFLIGSDYDKLNELDGKIESYKNHIDELDELLRQTENQGSIELLNEDKKEIKELNENIDKFVLKEKNKFSLFGWLFD